MVEQGKYPVIFLDMKGIVGNTLYLDHIIEIPNKEMEIFFQKFIIEEKRV